ncbi:MAG: ATP-binding protein, partial [Mangrovicoccus sp.]
ANGHVWVTAQEIENKIEFSITDDGPGIDPRFHERVFRLFQTLQSRDELEGSGMGLAIAKRHVEIAGGNIRLISDGNGSGSQFLFTWPKTI